MGEGSVPTEETGASCILRCLQTESLPSENGQKKMQLADVVTFHSCLSLCVAVRITRRVLQSIWRGHME